jgi:hypothetical protein
MYYNHRLYYPDPEYGGGGESGGGKDYEGDEPGTGGFPMGNGSNSGRSGYNINDPSGALPLAPVEPVTSATPTTKKIRSILVDKIDKLIDPRGEVRNIQVSGDVGAMFTLTLKDDSGCSILEDEMENIEISSNGKLEFIQTFPSITVDSGAFKSKEVYDLEITPAADVQLDYANGNISEIEPTVKLYQYADPIVTFTTTSSATSPALDVASSPTTFTKTSAARTFTRNLPGYSSTTYILTITEDEVDSGYFYVKNASFHGNLTSDTIIKKTVDRCGGTGVTRDLTLNPLTTRTETSIEGEDVISGDLQDGMSFYGKVEYNKTVRASLDVDSCYKATDRFELHETNDLLEGMIVTGDGVWDAEIVSVDCGKNITLNNKYIIKENTVLTFTKEWWGNVSEVVIDVNSKGQSFVKLVGGVDIPHGTTLEFDDNITQVSGVMEYAGSGSDTIVLTSTVDVGIFGIKDVTYTLDLDNIIGRKPNAHDQSVSTKKNTDIAIYMIKDDKDDNRTSKTGTVVTSPENGTVGSYTTASDTFRYSPNTGFTGEDSFTFTMNDGATNSEEKTIRITVK